MARATNPSTVLDQDSFRHPGLFSDIAISDQRTQLDVAPILSLQSNIWEGVMPKQQSWVEFLIQSVIGWIWIAASFAAVYFLVRAIFFGDGWWRVVASAAVAWFLYKVTLYYQLERTGQLPE